MWALFYEQAKEKIMRRMKAAPIKVLTTFIYIFQTWCEHRDGGDRKVLEILCNVNFCRWIHHGIFEIYACVFVCLHKKISKILYCLRNRMKSQFVFPPARTSICVTLCIFNRPQPSQHRITLRFAAFDVELMEEMCRLVLNRSFQQTRREGVKGGGPMMGLYSSI